jgi:GTPase SAR1 family protein
LYSNSVGDVGAAAIFGSGAFLRELRLGGNSITAVPACVRGLTHLEVLRLSDNKLVSVDAAIVALEGTLRKIDLSNNGDTLLQPPAPYARDYRHGDDGDRSPAALFRYFREAKQPYYHAKLVLVGNPHGGKTSTLSMLREGTACIPTTTAREALAQETVGVKVRSWTPSTGGMRAAGGVAAATGAATGAGAAGEAAPLPLQRLEALLDLEGGQRLQFRVFDLAGQVVYRASHQCTFSKYAFYLCVVNANDALEDAWENVLGWYDHLQGTVPGALFRLLLTHIDGAPARSVALLRRCRCAARSRRVDWRAKGAELLRRLHERAADRRRGLEQQQQQQQQQRGLDHHSGGANARGAGARPCTRARGVQLQDVTDVWGISNLTGEGVEELRSHLVATALNPELMPEVGQERPISFAKVEALALDSGGAMFVARAELRERAKAAGVDDDSTFDDALWFWHEVGSLLHYCHRTDGAHDDDREQLAPFVFVNPGWILELINALVGQKHKRTLGSLDVSQERKLLRLLDTGLLERSLLPQLWQEVEPPVAPEAIPVLLELLSQFDLLLPGPTPDSSWLTLLLPQSLADLPQAAQDHIDRQWPEAVAPGQAFVGTRFFFSSSLPAGLVGRLLARCANLASCVLVEFVCWREGMLATVGGGGLLRIHHGECADKYAHAATSSFVDILLRRPGHGGEAAARDLAPFLAVMEALLSACFPGILPERKQLGQADIVVGTTVTVTLGDVLCAVESGLERVEGGQCGLERKLEHVERGFEMKLDVLLETALSTKRLVDALARGEHDCPRHVFILPGVPPGGWKNTLNFSKVKFWAHTIHAKHMRLVLACAYDRKAVECGPDKKGYPIMIEKAWVHKYGPALRWIAKLTLLALRVSVVSSGVGLFPFGSLWPFPENPDGEETEHMHQLLLMEEILEQFGELVEESEEAVEMHEKLEHAFKHAGGAGAPAHLANDAALQKWTGASYRVLRALLNEQDPELQHTGLGRAVAGGAVEWVAPHNVAQWEQQEGCAAQGAPTDALQRHRLRAARPEMGRGAGASHEEDGGDDESKGQHAYYQDERQVPKTRWAEATMCQLCDKSFGLLQTGRHHCRRCGISVCEACSPGTAQLLSPPGHMSPDQPSQQRVCERCAATRELCSLRILAGHQV